MNESKINGFTILHIKGRLDTTNFNAFEKEIVGMIDKGESNIILNCGELNYISSSGLRVFLIAQKRITALQGKLYLCNLNPAIKEIFDISGFSSLFMIFNSENEALNA